MSVIDFNKEKLKSELYKYYGFDSVDEDDE